MAYYILRSFKLKVSPERVFEELKNRQHCFFLDSSLKGDHSLGRYSFLGIEPFSIIQTKGQDAFPAIRSQLAAYHLTRPKVDIPFLGGAVGYFAYDAGLQLEKTIKISAKVESETPDCWLGFYGAIIIIDRLKQLIYICATGFPEKKDHFAQLLAQEEFKKLYSILSRIGPDKVKEGKGASKEAQGKIVSSFSKAQYMSVVKKAKQYIRSGDIYQVNLAQEFRAQTGLHSPLIYQRLRSLSPSYFGAYQDCGDFQVVSSSPEQFLKLKGRLVVTRPMKGTRPRGENKSEDHNLKQELLKSAKDKAELTMIVDLERNDLGRVCSYNSIKVDSLRQMERYSRVFQTTATISGRLFKGKDRIDLLRACFPGGSIIGCPKIRAMEIIEELEPVRRSLYTGCMGYLSFCGNMELNVLIRTMVKKANEVRFGVGAGIVADSEPEEEYEETLVKAQAMREAIA